MTLITSKEKKMKVKLSDIKVQSFVTAEKQEIQGGRFISYGHGVGCESQSCEITCAYDSGIELCP